MSVKRGIDERCRGCYVTATTTTTQRREKLCERRKGKRTSGGLNLSKSVLQIVVMVVMAEVKGRTKKYYNHRRKQLESRKDF